MVSARYVCGASHKSLPPPSRLGQGTECLSLRGRGKNRNSIVQSGLFLQKEYITPRFEDTPPPPPPPHNRSTTAALRSALPEGGGRLLSHDALDVDHHRCHSPHVPGRQAGSRAPAAAWPVQHEAAVTVRRRPDKHHMWAPPDCDACPGRETHPHFVQGCADPARRCVHARAVRRRATTNVNGQRAAADDRSPAA